MKGKTLLSLAMLLSITLTLMPALVAAPPAEPYIEVVFQATGNNTRIIESCTPPITFKADLKIHGVTNMVGWATTIYWNKDVLNCTSIELGPFNAAGSFASYVINNDDGNIPKYAVGTVTPGAKISGTGISATITFLCKHTGNSLINITDSSYKPEGLEKVPMNEVDGTFECRPYIGPPRPPVATFDPPECTQFRLDKELGNVTDDFDACASQGSYDPLPDPGTENPILEYRWDFDGDAIVDYVSSGEITVALHVTDMEDCFAPGYPYFMGWSCRITWDPTKYTYLYSERGPFPDIPNVWMEINYTASSAIIVFGTTEMVNVTDPRVQGSGILDYIHFKPATACLPGEVVVTDSYVSVWRYNPWPKIEIAKTPCPFTPTYAYTPPDCHASWTYDEFNPTVPVTLTVYAPDCDPSETHGSFVDTDSVTNVIHILPPIMGPDIDVYTERDGIGKGCDKDTGEEYPPIVQYLADGTPIYKWTAMSDAYGPQEEVTLCALVTYNEEPVENKLVAFEIWDPDNNKVVYRSAPTGPDGIACVSFRIPWMGANAEDVFGAWLIIATVDIAEHVVMDKCRFRFGYIVNIYYVEHAPDPVHKLGDLAVKVYFVNIAFTEQDVFVTIVLYDECGVPIAKFSTPLSVDALGMPSPQYTLTIPKWAFVGTGTLYVNVFDKPPYLMGTPVCPENGGMAPTHVQIVP